MDWSAELIGLLLGSLLAATLLPGGSEAYLLWLVSQGEHAPATLVSVATLGNTLGGWLTFAMGWLFACGVSGWLKPSRRHQQVVSYLQRFGHWILLFSWLPLLGDPLCFAAGWLRLPVGVALLFILLGKAARYMLLVGLFS